MHCKPIMQWMCAIALLNLGNWGAPSYASPAPQAAEGRGTISGSVTADQGTVKAFRVKAKNAERGVTYTVFTRAGKYRVPEALAGSYEVWVDQAGFKSSNEKADLKAGDDKSVNVTLTKQPAPTTDAQYLDSDQVYPPGPGREQFVNTCIACHGWDYLNGVKRNLAGWRAAVRQMTMGPGLHSAAFLGRSQISAKDKEAIAQYMFTNFGPDSPKRELKRDVLDLDEAALSKAIYVEYELPANLPASPMRGTGGDATAPMAQRPAGAMPQMLHDPCPAPDGAVWFGVPTANAMARLDPKNINPQERWKVFPIKDVPGNVFVHGCAVDHEGRVYWAEVFGGRVGELDPETGKQIRHELLSEGSLLQVVVDQKDNVWYNHVHGSDIGVIDAKTRRISQWATPTADSSPYGLAVAPNGDIWTAGWAKGIIVGFDPTEEVMKEYKTPSEPSGPHRLGVDSKGIVWFSEYNLSKIGSLDPKTGKMAEYKLPYRYTSPYEVWPDNNDDIWVSDHFNNSIIKFDRKTQKFTYFPYPQETHWSVPKVEIEKNNTIWFGARGVPHSVAVHFYPEGYTAAAHAEP